MGFQAGGRVFGQVDGQVRGWVGSRLVSQSPEFAGSKTTHFLQFLKSVHNKSGA